MLRQKPYSETILNIAHPTVFMIENTLVKIV